MTEQKTGSVRLTMAALKDDLDTLSQRLETVAESGHSHPAAGDVETSVAGRCARGPRESAARVSHSADDLARSRKLNVR